MRGELWHMVCMTSCLVLCCAMPYYAPERAIHMVLTYLCLLHSFVLAYRD